MSKKTEQQDAMRLIQEIRFMDFWERIAFFLLCVEACEQHNLELVPFTQKAIAEAQRRHDAPKAERGELTTERLRNLLASNTD